MSEFSPDGTQIYRHEPAEPGFRTADTDGGCREAFEQHMRRVLGVAPMVFHELVSDTVHLDIYMYSPIPGRPYTVLATCGMSDLPMNVLPEAEADCQAAGGGSLKRAELLLALPPEWPLSQEAFEDERHYWPVRLLKSTARMPHLYHTWLGFGHTVPNGDPARPYAPGTALSGLVILPTVLDELQALNDVEQVPELKFYAVVPLTAAELDFKLTEGLDALLERFDHAGVNELLDPHRASLVAPPKRSWWKRR